MSVTALSKVYMDTTRKHFQNSFLRIKQNRSEVCYPVNRKWNA